MAALDRQCRDLDLAEDGFADAVEALLRLPAANRPANIAGWLYVAARRRIVDAVRRHRRGIDVAADLALLQEEPAMNAGILAFPDPIPDERLRLIFAACHPAISPDMRVALALKLLFGIDIDRLAGASLTTAPTLYQRIGRAKAKIRGAGIGFDVPARRHWPDRLEAVLETLELAYTLAYQDAAGVSDAELAPEVLRLADVLAQLLPDEPEVLAVAALVLLGQSRRQARIDDEGVMVPLSQQDPARWDGAAIARAAALLDRAAALARPGARQLIAAIHFMHARRVQGVAVDWTAIVGVYDALATLRPVPAVAVARALALAEVQGAAAGLAALDALDEEKLAQHRPYACARAHLMRQLGEDAAASTWWNRALALAPPPAEARWIAGQIAGLADRGLAIS